MKNGWEYKTIGEVCSTGAGGTPLKSGKGYYDGGTIPWLQSGEVSQGEIFEAKKFITDKGLKESSARLFPPNTVLVAMYGATAGEVGILRFEASTNQAVCGILPNEKFLPEFIFYFLLSCKEELVAQAVGGAQPNISQIKIKNTLIPVPPIEEQRQIVAILDEAFACIDKAKANTEKNIQNARELFDSYLNNIFSNPGPDWEEKRVGEIAKHSLGKMLDKRKNQGTPKEYLRNQSVRWFEFDLSDITEMRFLETETEKYTAVKGDVLIFEGGYPGRAAIWQNDEPIFFQKAVHRVRFHNPLHNRWLVYFLYVSDKNGNLRKSFTGAGIQHFTGEALGRFPLPIAPDGEISVNLAAFEDLMSKSEKLEQVFERKLSALGEMKKTVLQKAFAGELE